MDTVCSRKLLELFGGGLGDAMTAVETPCVAENASSRFVLGCAADVAPRESRRSRGGKIQMTSWTDLRSAESACLHPTSQPSANTVRDVSCVRGSGSRGHEPGPGGVPVRFASVSASWCGETKEGVRAAAFGSRSDSDAE